MNKNAVLFILVLSISAGCCRSRDTSAEIEPERSGVSAAITDPVLKDWRERGFSAEEVEMLRVVLEAGALGISQEEVAEQEVIEEE